MDISSGLPELALAIRTLVALMFLTAAYSKGRHLTVFEGVVANYRLLPEALVRPFARALPAVEALLGVALLVNVLPPAPGVAAIGLLLLFALAMGINLNRGRREIDCGCFQSTLKQTLSWKLVIRNLGLSALLAVSAPVSAFPSEFYLAVNGWLAGGVLFVILQSVTLLWGIVPSWHRRRRQAEVSP